MDSAKGREAVAFAAILHETRLERRLHAGDLGEVDVSLERPAAGYFDVKLFKFPSVHHRDPRLFRVGGIDQHCFGHASDAPRAKRRTRIARTAARIWLVKSRYLSSQPVAISTTMPRPDEIMSHRGRPPGATATGRSKLPPANLPGGAFLAWNRSKPGVGSG